MREFDALRGFSMLTVMYVHTLNTMDLGRITLVGNVIESFFMPLFFFISGYFAFKESERWTNDFCCRFVTQKAKALIVSTVFFYALLYFSRGENPLGWLDGGFRAYWFTIVLFDIMVLYVLASKISFLIKRDCHWMMIVLSVTGMVLLAIHALPYNNRWWIILGGSNLCLFLQYFAVGLLCRKYWPKAARVLTYNWLYTLGLILYVASICLWYTPEVAASENIRTSISIVQSYLAIYLLMVLFTQAKNYFNSSVAGARWICKVGSRSLYVYMLHYFFIPSLIGLHSLLAPANMILLQLAVVIPIVVAIASICLFLSDIIRKSAFLSDWLFGNRRKAELN